MGRTDGMRLGGSRGRSIVVLQHPAEPLSTVNGSVRVSRRDEGTDQSVVQPLMIPFVVVVVHELAHRAAQRAFADEDQPLDAGFLDGADEALGEGVQIG